MTLRLIGVSAILFAPREVQGGPPALTSVTNFNSTYNQTCGGGAANSTACKSLLYNETRSHFAYTDYLNRENEAVEDVLKALEKDWGFAVTQFAAINPAVTNFVSTNKTTMSALVSNLSSSAQDFVNKVNPVLAWAHRGLQTLLEADSLDTLNFTNVSDAAVQRLLNQAMTVGQIFPHQVNMYAKNASEYADKFFNTEFFRVKNAVNSKFAPLQDLLKRVQKKLSDQRDYVSTQINFMNVTASQMNDTMSLEIPERLANQRQAIITTLRDRIAQRLGGAEIQRQTAQVNDQLATYGTQQALLFNETFFRDMDSVLDSVEARMNQTIVAAAAQAQNYTAQFGQASTAGADNWADISDLLTALTSATSNEAAQYLVSDADFGNDSIANFRVLRDDILAGIEGTGGAVGALVNAAMTDLDANAFAVRLRLGQAIDNMVTTDTNQTIQGLQEWARYTNELYSSVFDSMMASYEDGLQNITDSVLMRINGVTVGKKESFADAGVKSILGSNLNMLNASELAEQENNMTALRNNLFRFAQDRFFGMVNAINATGRDMDLQALKVNSEASLTRSENYVRDELQKVSDADNIVMTGIRLKQIDEPIAQAIDKFNGVKNRVQTLVKRNADITTRLAGLSTNLKGSASEANRKIAQMDTMLVSRARAMDNLFKTVGDEMTAAIGDFVSQFVGSLPSTTGFVRMVQEREQNVTNARDFVSRNGLDIKQRIDDQAGIVKSYKDRLGRASNNFATARAEIVRRDSVRMPDFVGLNRIRNLSERFDAAETLKKQNYAIVGETNRISQEFKDKELLVVKALGQATRESSARDSELSDYQAKVAAKNTTFNAMKTTYNEKVGKTVISANNALNASDVATKGLVTRSRSQMNQQTQLLVQAISDLLYQVGSSGPQFLAQHETEKISDLAARLQNLNSTLPSVVPSASVAVSLLHQNRALRPAGPSPTLVEVMAAIHNKSEIESLKTSIAMGVKAIESAIAQHKDPSVNFPDQPGKSEQEFVDTTDTVFGKLREILPRLSRNVNAFDKIRSNQLEAFFKGNQTEISEAVANIRTVIRNISNAEKSVLRTAIREIRMETQTFNETIAELSDLAVSIEKNAIKVPDFNKDLRLQNMTKTPAAYPKVDKMKVWLSTFVADSQRAADQRISSERTDLNKTLNAIEKMHETLSRIVSAEDKVESEFETKILPKLVERNRQVNETTDSTFGAVEKAIDNLTKTIRAEGVITV